MTQAMTRALGMMSGTSLDGVDAALIETDGTRREFRVGDAVIIPAGFKGIFEVTEPMKKHYVIIDRQEQIA